MGNEHQSSITQASSRRHNLNNNNIDTVQAETTNVNNESLHSMDLSMCQTTHSQCFGGEIEDGIDINKCAHLQRMLRAIKYYKLLDSTQNASRSEILASFYSDIYKEIINDYQHIISTHSGQYESVYNQIISDHQYAPCDHQTCKLFNRYYTTNIRESSMSMDSRSIFLSDLLDCYALI